MVLTIKKQRIYEKFDKMIYLYMSRLLRLIGLDVIDPNFVPSVAILVFLWLLTLIYFLLAVGTFVTTSDDHRIEVFTFVAIGLQGPIKLYTLVAKRQQYIGLMDTCRNAYKAAEHFNSPMLYRETAAFVKTCSWILNVQCNAVVAAAILVVCPSCRYTCRCWIPAAASGIFLTRSSHTLAHLVECAHLYRWTRAF